MARWIVAIAILAGCEKSVFNCDVDDDCTVGSMTGTCQSDHLCSVPDASCMVGQRYGPYSGDVTGQCVQVNYMFVTSKMIDPTQLGANNDALGAADDICNTAAQMATPPLPGHFIAWISSNGTSPFDRLDSHAARGWIRPDKLPFVDTTRDLSNGNILYPPRIDENLVDHGSDPLAMSFVATGTDENGALPNNDTNWTTASAYAAGRVTFGRQGWTSGSNRNGMARLYCFGTDHHIAPLIPSVAGSIAFVSSKPFMLGGGIADADKLCHDDAPTTGSSAKFLAFIATTGATAAARFTEPSAPWVRVDGLPLGDPLTGQLATPISLGPDRQPGSQTHVWTGAADPSTPATAASDCSGWTMTGSGSSGLQGLANDSGAGFFDAQGITGQMCNAVMAHVYCLQTQ